MVRFVFSLLLCGSLFAATPNKVQQAKAALVHVAEVAPKSLVLRLGDRDIGIVHTKVRYDTWIILPPDESITGAGSGDNENWQVKPADDKRATNLFHVQPSKENTRTNLNLRTSAGRYYSLLLIEDSACSSCQPDLKVFIEPTEIRIPNVQMGFGITPGIDYQKKIEDLNVELDAAKAETKRVRIDAGVENERQITAFRAEYPLSLKCGYSAKFDKAPFNLEAICTDGTFTYIKSASSELPSLYIEKDGKPALVQFKYIRGESAHEGTYVIDSVITRGHLQLGKKKLKFAARAIGAKA